MGKRTSTSFSRDNPRPGPGRPKGLPNKATLAVKEAARQLVEQPEYRQALSRRLLSGRLAPAMETTLWHYAYGKPRETHEHVGDVSLLTRVVHEHHDA